MAEFIWTLQGTTPTEIGETDIIQFAAATFGSKIGVGEYNDSTHVEDEEGGDVSEENGPFNSKFISEAGGTGGVSQVDIGEGTVDLDSVLDEECPLLINFSHDTSVITEDAIFYAYDGETTTEAPVGVICYIAEVGNTAWTDTAGSGSALSLSDQETDTSHDFFILVSASPDSVGEKTDFVLRIELSYS